ncbi:hypothetical protein LTR37_019895 [Vermiconidia calcicola]|uniref:Uncharacterized protein n=1 Tax=Vermiconidia calcicola TaxID=1690605 RepID=A0ACC3MEN8_9PEZI|nr:hypothetical protein LTR37_019895 [Vermiconidia calcicola]
MCDTKPGGCTQCRRARRECPGYRVQVDVIFHDQSENVIRKAKASEARRAAFSSKSSPEVRSTLEHGGDAGVEDPDGLELVTQQRFDTIFSIRPTLEERATCHFFFHYIIGIHPPADGALDNLSVLYKANVVDETLATAVRAVSLASYANHMRSSELTDKSRYQYTRAISLANSALSCPESAVENTTLLSVMILGMFEVIGGRSQRSVKAWLEHVRGSAALIKLRGYEQLNTLIGRRLFLQAMTGILTSCIQLMIAIPENLMEMTRRLPDVMNFQEDWVRRSIKLHLAMLEVNQLRAAIAKGTITDRHAILAQAVELNQGITSILDDPPAQWQFHYFPADDQPGSADVFYHGFAHNYSDTTVATMWNAARVMRILLNESIRDNLLKGFAVKPPVFTLPEHTAQFQLSTDICYQLQAEILASVPHHLGYVRRIAPSWTTPGTTDNWRNMEQWSNDPSATEPCGEGPASESCSPDSDVTVSTSGTAVSSPFFYATGSSNPARATGGLNLLWPLFLAGMMEVSTDEVRQYCVRIFKHIGDDMGIRQALVLAKVVESRTWIEAWHDKSSVGVE